jgi:hypothetical protein
VRLVTKYKATVINIDGTLVAPGPEDGQILVSNLSNYTEHYIAKVTNGHAVYKIRVYDQTTEVIVIAVI